MAPRTVRSRQPSRNCCRIYRRHGHNDGMRGVGHLKPSSPAGEYIKQMRSICKSSDARLLQRRLRPASSSIVQRLAFKAVASRCADRSACVEGRLRSWWSRSTASLEEALLIDERWVESACSRQSTLQWHLRSHGIDSFGQFLRIARKQFLGAH